MAPTSTTAMAPKLVSKWQTSRSFLANRLTVDYGVLTILSKPLFWLLEKIHSVVPFTE